MPYDWTPPWRTVPQTSLWATLMLHRGTVTRRPCGCYCDPLVFGHGGRMPDGGDHD